MDDAVRDNWRSRIPLDLPENTLESWGLLSSAATKIKTLKISLPSFCGLLEE